MPSSAQWMSSIARTSGASLAEQLDEPGAPRRRSDRGPARDRRPREPRRGRRFPAAGRSARRCGRRRPPPSGPASSSMPATSFATPTSRRLRAGDPEPLAQDLPERRVGRGGAVGRRAADQRLGGIGPLRERGGELVQQPRLPDARLPEDRDQVRARLPDGALEQREQQGELLVAADQRRRGRRGAGTETPDRRRPPPPRRASAATCPSAPAARARGTRSPPPSAAGSRRRR